MAGQKDISAQVYENKLKGSPRSLVFSRLADSYRKRGDIQQAVDVCSLGLKNHPRSTTGHVILGRCYLEQEKFKEAIREFTQVIESDHRNQMALKMLADIYARQGLKEKAGDLYAYLRAMDPENRSIVSLCTNFSGTGKTNIHEILGLAVSGPSSFSKTESNREAQQDILEDIDKTISLRVVTDETLPQDAGPFAQTMQFDAEELKAAPQDQDFQVEEVIGDIAQNVEDSVTGDDITSRMSLMFEEEEKTGDQDVPFEAPETMKLEAKARDQEVTEQMPLTALETPEGYNLSMGLGTEISGGDISSRIDQLFGDQQQDASPAAALEYSQTFGFAPENSGRSEAPADRQSGAFDTLPDAAQEELAVVQDGPDATDISGEDVVNRMSQLFEPAAEAMDQPQSQLSHEPASLGEKDFDKTIRFDAVPGPMRENGIDENKNDVISGVSEEINSSIEESSHSDELAGEPAFDAASSITDEGAALVEEEAISGDDVAARLETIFDEQDLGEVPSNKSDQSPLSDVVDDDAPPSADQISVADEPIDRYDNTLVPGSEQTLEATAIGDEEEKQIPLGGPLPVTEEPYGDIVTGEESPEMSGDDIVNRLTEIFPDKLLQEDTLSILESIPDDEKEDEEVNAGFYTMSGENAQTTAQSEETLFERLDDVQIETASGPGAESKDAFAREISESQRQDAPDENKTVLNAPDDSDRLYSIPDHVLTPTLADIYFQQGQPNLAVQIYSRLLERDPDNEKIARRLEEIKSCISEGRAPAPPEEIPMDSAAKKVPESNPKPSRKPRANKAQRGHKPLEGVRIKKAIRNKRK
jgi:tetratricopeptide (TPR) repeat protein